MASTELYNSCMWAADSAHHPELALQLLKRMEKEEIKRDMTTYVLNVILLMLIGL